MQEWAGLGCVRPRHPTSFDARSFVGFSVWVSCAVKGSWAAEPHRSPVRLDQPSWSSLSSAAFGLCWMLWPQGIMDMIICLGILVFVSSICHVASFVILFVVPYCCIALKATVKNFSSFTDLSLPFRFSGFYLHRGDPWKSLAVPFISPIQKLQYRYTLCLCHSIGQRGEFCHCIFHSLIMKAPI